MDLEWYDGPRKGLALVDGVPHYDEVSDAGLEEHPGHGGIDARYDELALLLAPRRQAPDGARRLVGEARFDDGDDRYRSDGVDHWFRWRPAK